MADDRVAQDEKAEELDLDEAIELVEEDPDASSEPGSSVRKSRRGVLWGDQ